jgi:hypothetical protein
MRPKPADEVRTVSTVTFAAASLAVVAMAALVVGCSADPARDPHAVSRAQVQARNGIAVRALVPKSLVYRNERVVFHDGRPTVCGEFNGQDRRGAFAGFTRYMMIGDELTIDDRRPAFKRRWTETCASV